MSANAPDDSGFGLADAVAGLFIASVGAAGLVWGSVYATTAADQARRASAALSVAELLLVDAEVLAYADLARAGELADPVVLRWVRTLAPLEDGDAPGYLWRVSVHVQWGVAPRQRSVELETLVFRPDWEER